MRSPALVVDSAMTRDEALRGLDPACPAALRDRQELLTVRYYSFDGNLHQGQLLLDRDLAADVQAVFALILSGRFPVASAIPVADPRFLKNGRWDDDLSMAANNSSAFNYREITGGGSLSRHSLGTALDINPLQNPYVKNGLVLPAGAVYDPAAPGTLTAGHPVTREFLSRGWTWGGTWESLKDYQHFEKTRG
jgi:hypothetical protein